MASDVTTAYARCVFAIITQNVVELLEKPVANLHIDAMRFSQVVMFAAKIAASDLVQKIIVTGCTMGCLCIKTSRL